MPRSQSEVKKILENYDLLICVGSDVLRMSVWSSTEPLPKNMSIIHIGIRDWELAKNYHTEQAILGNVKTTLLNLNKTIANNLNKKYKNNANRRIKEIEKINWSKNKKNLTSTTLKDKDIIPITPDWLMMTLAENISNNNIVVEEALVSSRSLLNFLPFKNSKDFYGLASGGIGWAVSGCIGVSLANNNKTIVAIIGDGSSMYAIQSIWTAAHYNLPIIYVIANNQSYRIIKERLEGFHNNTNFVGMDFNKPKIDFVKLGNSMGVESKQVSEPTELKSLFKKAFKYKKPYLIEVMVDKGY